MPASCHRITFHLRVMQLLFRCIGMPCGLKSFRLLAVNTTKALYGTVCQKSGGIVGHTNTHIYRYTCLCIEISYWFICPATRLSYLVASKAPYKQAKEFDLESRLALHDISQRHSLYIVYSEMLLQLLRSSDWKILFFFCYKDVGKQLRKASKGRPAHKVRLPTFLFYLFLSNICTISTHLLRVVV